MKTINAMATGREGRGCTHFYIDGKRVPYDVYFNLRGEALHRGRIDGFRSEQNGGCIRHHSVFHIPEGVKQ